jgi:hypothetical protein
MTRYYHTMSAVIEHHGGTVGGKPGVEEDKCPDGASSLG